MISFPIVFRQFRFLESFLILGFFIVGTIFAQNSVLPVPNSFIPAATGWYLLVFSFYAFNSWGGYAHDASNRRLGNPHCFSRKTYLLTSFASLIASVLLLLGVGCVQAILGILVFLMCAIYSIPSGLKYHPPFGTIMHFTVGMTQFSMGWMLVRPFSCQTLLIGIYFSLLFAGGHLTHELIDHDVDSRAEMMSGSIRFGKERMFTASGIVFFSANFVLLILVLQDIVAPHVGIPLLILGAVHIGVFLYVRRKWICESRAALTLRTIYRTMYLVAGIAIVVIKS